MVIWKIAQLLFFQLVSKHESIDFSRKQTICISFPLLFIYLFIYVVEQISKIRKRPWLLTNGILVLLSRGFSWREYPLVTPASASPSQHVSRRSEKFSRRFKVRTFFLYNNYKEGKSDFLQNPVLSRTILYVLRTVCVLNVVRCFLLFSKVKNVFFSKTFWHNSQPLRKPWKKQSLLW